MAAARRPAHQKNAQRSADLYSQGGNQFIAVARTDRVYCDPVLARRLGLRRR